MKIGSLCTGYGGLDMAVRSLYPDAQTVWVSDIDPYVNRWLEQRIPVPNIGDITDLPDVEPVDAITAGFPCQPVSTAGQRKGTEDDRWIFDDIATLASRMDPHPILYLENVPGLLSANGGDAMGRVVHRLAEIGYVGSYRLLRASDVGACHRRERWFCIAYPVSERTGLEGPRPGRQGREPSRNGEPAMVRLGDGPADAEGTRTGDVLFGTPRAADGMHQPLRTWRQGENHRGRLEDQIATLPTPTAWLGRRPANSRISANPRHGGKVSVEVTDAVATLPTPKATNNENQPSLGYGPNLGTAIRDSWGDYADAITRHEHALGRPAPEPTTDGRLNPVFVEWMMMLPQGWVTDPGLGLSRTAQLKMLGNGVVPAQAAAAYRLLLDIIR